MNIKPKVYWGMFINIYLEFFPMFLLVKHIVVHFIIMVGGGGRSVEYSMWKTMEVNFFYVTLQSNPKYFGHFSFFCVILMKHV